MPPQQSKPEPSTHAITIRLPEDLYEELRRQAFEKRTSINALIVEAARHAAPGHVTSRRAGPRHAT